MPKITHMSGKKNTKKNKVIPFNFKTSWDFTDIYESIDDQKIEKDVQKIEKAYVSFATKYEKKDFTRTEQSLKEALGDWEHLAVQTASWKPIWYLSQMLSLNSDNDKAKSLKNKYYAQLVNAANRVIFFNLAIGKIDAKKQKTYLASKALAPYRYALELIFRNAKYQLTEKEEKICYLKNQVSHNMWIDAQKKLLGQTTIKWKGKEVPLEEAMMRQKKLPTKERRALQVIATKKLREISLLAEAEMVAVITDKKIEDELRGYKTPYESTVLGYQNDLKTVDALVTAVDREHKTTQKFFEMKRKFLKLDKMTPADRAVEITEVKKEIPVEMGVELVTRAFRKAGDYYSDLLQKMLKEGRIDMFPKKGKRGGAYCSGGTGIPTVIFMNYVDDMNSVSTLAHEMGHAIHSELSKAQTPIYEDYVISVAEVASTFFEFIVFDEVQKELTPREQIYARMAQIEDDVFTIYRQIGFFNYELALHTHIREKGYMTREEMARVYADMTKKFLGKNSSVSEDDGYVFLTIPHFRYYFYVYSYAYGQLISRALFAKYKQDHTYIDKVKSFLSAGGSMSPADIFKSIGIDTTDPQFFIDGLKAIRKELDEVEKLAKKEKMIK